MKQSITLYIVIGIIIGFSVVFFAFIDSPPIQTTEAESVDVYPKFKNQNPQTLNPIIIPITIYKVILCFIWINYRSI